MDVKRSEIYLLGSFILLFLGILPSIEGKHGALRATAELSSDNCSNHFHPSGEDADLCLPRITGQHFNLFCLDHADADRLPAPEVVHSCDNISSLNFRERYLELGCQATGFSGYFAPSNWKTIKILGDGGVDVTGAPNEQLVEGANNTLISVIPGGRLAIQIAIPADGLITFNWSKIGGSNLFPADFSVRINEQVVAVSRRAAPRGCFRTPVLHQGDQLVLLFTPQLQNGALQLELGDFQFLTSAMGVIERTWTATDEKGRMGSFRQFISIERPNLTDVVFPENPIGSDAPAIGEDHSFTPASTGFPVIDRDGNLATTDDQYRLDQGDLCGLEVSWHDEIQTLGDACMLLRHWVITDWCGGNTLEETQVLRLVRRPGATGCPENEQIQLFSPPVSRNAGKGNDHYETESEYTTL